MRYAKIIIAGLVMTVLIAGCAPEASSSQHEYGVYLSSEYEDLPENLECDVLVIDAQYYTKKEIEQLHENNEKIYSYINVGAIENFREYYDEFTDIILGSYENWPEESFMDVSQERWQNFLVDSLGKELKSKGIDGFFVDNIDVYYEYQREDIYNGITNILKGLKSTGKNVIVNGGDVYISKYIEENDNLDDIIDGINQECVFTSINWDENTFSESTNEERQYFLDYLKNVDNEGAEIYLIEYTKNSKLARNIRSQCEKLDYRVYVSDSIELD